MGMQSNPRARGAYKKSEVSRGQVLKAAVAALAERGYARTSISDIARVAGMSKGAVHYHFENKDELIAKVLEYCAAVSLERLRQAWDAPGEPREKIQRAVREMRAIRKEGPIELRVLADLAAQGIYDEPLREQFRKVFETNRYLVVEHLTRSLDEIGLRPTVPVGIIPRLLLGALDGLAMHDYFDPPSEAEDGAIEDAIERVALSLFETGADEA